MFENLQLRLSLPASPISNPYPSNQGIPRLPLPRRMRRRPAVPYLIVSFTVFTLIAIAYFRSSAHIIHGAEIDGKGGWTDWGEWGDMADIVDRFGTGLGRGKEMLGLDVCSGWDPLAAETDDPEGCLKARQFRQVQRVLIREEKREHGHWGFTNKANLVTLRKLSKCFLPSHDENYTPCPDRPLIINGYWWSALTVTNGTSGECIWQESVQFEQYNISSLFVGDYSNWVVVAEMMPDVYRFIWAHDTEIISCFTDPRCVAAEHYTPPHGAEDLSIGVPDEERGVIPIWRLQVIDYWGAQPKEISNNDHYWGLTKNGNWSYHSLGTQWISTPWPMPGHVHVPYSIEDYCLKLPVKPHAERNDSVLIFAKRSSYFHIPHVSPMHFWSDLSREPNFTLLSTAGIEVDNPLPEGLTTLGHQSREAYEGVVGGSKVLLGMGFPPISPSVYTALCQGTPVVLPYRGEMLNLKTGWDMFRGQYQHGPAMAIGPPYVYSFQKENYTQLVEMVNKALETPIKRYIPDDMKLPFAAAKIQEFLERDLHNMFRKVLRENGGQIPRLQARVKERCMELNRCKPTLPEGRLPRTPEWSRRVAARSL